MDDIQIKAMVRRLSRPHLSGGVVIERAAILADGTDSRAVMEWIAAHAGRPEVAAVQGPRRGIHGVRLRETTSTSEATPLRFVLPADALE